MPTARKKEDVPRWFILAANLSLKLHQENSFLAFERVVRCGGLLSALPTDLATKHLDAAQLLRKAQKLDATVDRSTVYRTLQLLKRHGLIDELDLMHIHGEGHYYERKLNRDHIHMACLRCGKITEFESDLFDRLKGQIQRDCRFHIVVTRLEVGGYCAQCRTPEQPKD